MWVSEIINDIIIYVFDALTFSYWALFLLLSLFIWSIRIKIVETKGMFTQESSVGVTVKAARTRQNFEGQTLFLTQKEQKVFYTF